MNGLTPADCILLSIPYKLLYIFFLVVSNWAILAILTAVVSDHMLFSTQNHDKQESLENAEIDKENRRNRMEKVFMTLDKDPNGHLSEAEFQKLMGNKELSQEICSASDLNPKDLKDLFLFLNYQDTNGELKIDCEDFIEKLGLESNDVCERSVLRVEKQLKSLEKRMDEKLDTVVDDLHKSVSCILKIQQLHPDDWEKKEGWQDCSPGRGRSGSI